MPEDEIDKLIAQAESAAAGAGDDLDKLIADAEAAVAKPAQEKPRGTFVPMDQLDNSDRTPVGANRPWYYDWLHPAEAAARASNEVQSDPYFKQRAGEVAQQGEQLSNEVADIQSSPENVAKFAGRTALGVGGQYLGGLAGLAAPEVEGLRQFAKHPELTAALGRVGAGAAGGAIAGGTDAAAHDQPILPAAGQGALWGGGLTGLAEGVGAGANVLGNKAQAAANKKLARTAYPNADLDQMRTRGGEPALAEAGQELRDLGLTEARSLLDVSANPRRLAANATDLLDQSLSQLESAENQIRKAPTGELRKSAPGEFAPVTAEESPVDIGIARRKLAAEANRANWENNPNEAAAYQNASDRITSTRGAQPAPEFYQSIADSSPTALMSRVPGPEPRPEPAYSGASPELASLPEQTSYSPDPRAVNLAEPVPAPPESFTVDRSTRPEQPSWPAVGGIEPSRVDAPLYSIEPHGPAQAPLAGNLDLSAPRTHPNEPGLMLNPAPAPPLEMTGLDDTNLFARERTPGFAVPDLEKQAGLAHDVSMRMTNADMPWGAERPVGPTSPVSPQPPRGLHQFDQTHFAPELDAPMSTPDVPAGGADLESPLWTPPEPAPVIEHPPQFKPGPEIRVVNDPVPEKPAPWAPYGGPLPMDLPPETPLPAQAPAPPFDMTGALDAPPGPRPPQFPYDPNAYTIGKTIDVRRNLSREIRDWGDPKLNKTVGPYEQKALKKGWQGLGDVLDDAFTHGTPDPAAVKSRAEANKTFSTVADVAPTLARKANRADLAADRGTATGSETAIGGGLKGWEAVKNALTGINTSYNIGQGLKGAGHVADATSELSRMASGLGWFNQSEKHPEIAKAAQENPQAPAATVQAEANESMKEKLMGAWYNTKGFAKHLFE